MKKFLFTIALMACATMSWAVEVECTPGNLSNLIDDATITELTITGSIDARDFKFIADELEYLTTINLSGASIIAYASTTPVFATYTSYDEASIPPLAFFDKKLTQVTLPAGLKNIGMAAFAGCQQLNHIALPESLDSIGSYAFSASGLNMIDIPANLKGMGEGVFSRCMLLSSAIINVNEDFTIGKDAFYDCQALTSVILGEGVTAIDAGAFAGTKQLNSITFSGTNNIKAIGKAAFIESGMTNFNFATSTTLSSVDDWAFANSKQVSVELPSATTHLGKGAFYFAEDLSSFLPSASLDSISDYLLAGTAVSNDNAIGKAVKTIGNYAFYNTPAESLTIPASVTYIGTQAMAGMTQLQSLTSDATTVPELGEDVWAGVNQAVIPLYVPIAAFDAYNEASQWQNFMITKKFIYGDVNCDGSVNAADVTALYSYILQGNTTFIATSDVNGDQSINAADVTAVYGVILGKSNGQHVPSYINSNDEMSADDFTINNGESHWIEINLNNSTEYTAMQFDIDMPQGLTINAVKITKRTNVASVAFSEVENGKWRILSSSSTNATWKGDNGAIFSIEVIADDTFSGNENINFNNIIAVEPCEDIHMISDMTVGVSNTTGVKDITIAPDEGPVDVYNTHGQLIRKSISRAEATNGLPSGIYIVDGKKVLVK